MIVNPILYQQGVKLPELENPGAAADLLAGKQLVDQYGNPLTGTMPEVEQAVPSVSVSSSGLITASTVQEAGHVAAGSKSSTKQLATQAGKTVTPGTSRQTAVASGRYTTGPVYVAGDTNLKAENIKNGVSIFGVVGSMGIKAIQLTKDMISIEGSNLIVNFGLGTIKIASFSLYASGAAGGSPAFVACGCPCDVPPQYPSYLYYFRTNGRSSGTDPILRSQTDKFSIPCGLNFSDISLVFGSLQYESI